MSSLRFRFPSPRWVFGLTFCLVLLLGGAGHFQQMRAHQKFRVSEANTYAKSIERAVISFSNEYGDNYPVDGSAAEGDMDASSAPGSATVHILLGKDKRNPRKMDFLGDMKTAKQDNAGLWRGGLLSLPDPAGDSYGLVDPWGNPYQIRMDTNFDGTVADPRSPGLPPVAQRVIVWSAGADRDPATWADNVRTWEDEAPAHARN